MFLAELVLHGVRGFRELARLRFKGGFNFVAAGNESGKSTATYSIQRLLFPSNQTALLETLLSKNAPEAARSALVMCSDDGAYYRIIQDFSKRALNLSRYNATNKDFTLLHKDWDSAVQFMAEMTSGMTEDDFARIFIFQREHHAAGPAAPALSATPRSAPVAPVPSVGGQSSGDRKKLAELREALRKAEEAADAEYKCQAAKLALEETGKKIDSLGELEKKKADMEATIASLKGYEKMPEDFAGLIDAYERLEGQKLADSDELNKQIEAVKGQLGEIPTVNVITNKLFLTGAAVLALSILAGVFVLTDELAYLFPIGILVSFFLMAGGWYNGSQKGVLRQKLLQEEENLKKELAELEHRFQREGTTISAYMRSTGATSPAELKEKAENRRYLLSLGADLEERRQRCLGELTPEMLRQRYEQQQQQVVELEKAAQAVAQYNVDTFCIRQDIERLDSEASAVSSAAGASLDFGVQAQEPPVDFADLPAGGAQGGFFAELGIASRVGGIEMGTLVPAVEAAAQRNLVAVTAGKYVRLEACHEGGPIVHAKDDSILPFSELSHGTRSLVYFCFRTGLVEALAGKKRFPFILDDSLADFDPTRQKAACQVLRALGTKTQVILFSSNPALRAEGDAAAELK